MSQSAASRAPLTEPEAPAAYRGGKKSSVTYQVFILGVMFFSLVIAGGYYLLPVPPEVREVLYVVDAFNALILLADFGLRLFYAPKRLRYLLRGGVLDLIGGIPGWPILRFARLPALIAQYRQLRQVVPAEARLDARKRLAESVLLSTVVVVLLVVTLGSIIMVLAESASPDANIVTGDDAIWWAIVTVSTVGYGDRYPTTPVGRLVGTLMIFVGVSLFSVLTSYISTLFVTRRRRLDEQNETALLRAQLTTLFEQQRQAAEAEADRLHADIAGLREQIEQLTSRSP
jgi:voltage-gated potassium channel